MKNKIFLSIILIILIGCTSKEITLGDFAQCLTEKEAVMYGTEWCPHCQSQKALFEEFFQYINYVDCELNREDCIEKGIQGFPTWIIDGESYPGEQPLSKLASLAKCEI
jgi:glutaredoxin